MTIVHTITEQRPVAQRLYPRPPRNRRPGWRALEKVLYCLAIQRRDPPLHVRVDQVHPVVLGRGVVEHAGDFGHHVLDIALRRHGSRHHRHDEDDPHLGASQHQPSMDQTEERID
ncbi:MAG: hypothetical protein OXH63_05890 [Gemmatimonadetes bacterium]|nr:hypothetical protein [Gemmatimonadota bacterium]